VALEGFEDGAAALGLVELGAGAGAHANDLVVPVDQQHRHGQLQQQLVVPALEAGDLVANSRLFRYPPRGFFQVLGPGWLQHFLQPVLLGRQFRIEKGDDGQDDERGQRQGQEQ
jgi:hypothetical protein